MASVLFSLPWGGLQNIINPEGKGISKDHQECTEMMFSALTSLQEHLRIISAASLACTSTCLFTLKLSVIPSSFMHPTLPSVMFKPLGDKMLRLTNFQGRPSLNRDCSSTGIKLEKIHNSCSTAMSNQFSKRRINNKNWR